ncbi:MAG: hypothetical protein P8Y93_10215, partial [Acidobacteriota bacterium]
MKKTIAWSAALLTLVALILPALKASAEEEWKKMKREAKAQEIVKSANEALEDLFKDKPKAKDLYESAYGWAAFNNMKLAFGFSGGGGNGVAIEKESGKQTFMKMGTVGVGIGLGINKYNLIFLFQDSKTFNNFVEKGWQADAGATAAAGTHAVRTQLHGLHGARLRAWPRSSGHYQDRRHRVVARTDPDLS